MMPTLLGRYEFKIEETIPGELFRIDLRGTSAVCLNLEIYEGAVIVGILQSNAVETPSYFRNGMPKQICLSHGNDWCLDANLDEGSYPVNSYAGSEPRKLYLRDNFAILQMQKAGTQNGHDIVETDILGSGRLSIDQNAFPVTRWAIWASEAERNRPGTSPIVQFGVASN